MTDEKIDEIWSVMHGMLDDKIVPFARAIEAAVLSEAAELADAVVERERASGVSWPILIVLHVFAEALRARAKAVAEVKRDLKLDDWVRCGDGVVHQITAFESGSYVVSVCGRYFRCSSIDRVDGGGGDKCPECRKAVGK